MEQRNLINKKYEPILVWQTIVLGYTLIGFLFFLLFMAATPGEYMENFLGASFIGIFPFLIHLGLKAGPVLNTYFICNDSEIIYRKNFISLVQIRVKYTDIKEVILYQGIIQKKMKIGTVSAITQANIGDAGIALFDIKEYQEIYDFLIEKTKDNKLK